MKSSGEVNKRDCVIVARTVLPQVATLLICLKVGVAIKENFTSIEKLRQRYLEEALHLSALPDQGGRTAMRARRLGDHTILSLPSLRNAPQRAVN